MTWHCVHDSRNTWTIPLLSGLSVTLPKINYIQEKSENRILIYNMHLVRKNFFCLLKPCRYDPWHMLETCPCNIHWWHRFPLEMKLWELLFSSDALGWCFLSLSVTQYSCNLYPRHCLGFWSLQSRGAIQSHQTVCSKKSCVVVNAGVGLPALWQAQPQGSRFFRFWTWKQGSSWRCFS